MENFTVTGRPLGGTPAGFPRFAAPPPAIVLAYGQASTKKQRAKSVPPIDHKHELDGYWLNAKKKGNPAAYDGFCAA